MKCSPGNVKREAEDRKYVRTMRVAWSEEINCLLVQIYQCVVHMYTASLFFLNSSICSTKFINMYRKVTYLLFIYTVFI